MVSVGRSMLFVSLYLAWGMGQFARAAEFADRFADRQVVKEASAEVIGNNALATVEPDEPRHGDRRGGHSLWISWEAPANGLATFSTAGSSFDTLLAVYRLESDGDGDDEDGVLGAVSLSRLRRVSQSDDSDRSQISIVQFAARAGERYEIAVDGYAGQTGEVRLRWTLTSSAQPPPIVLSSSGDAAVRVGDTVTLSIGLELGREVELRWYFNGEEVPDAESTTLVIPSFQRQHVGRYRLLIKFDDLKYFTAPIELQINTEGQTATLARDKLEDAEESGLRGERGERDDSGRLSHVGGRRLGLMALPIGGVARGYSGTQVFNTTYATRDEGEPQHCGVSGGASYWFSYQPPVDGLLHLDTSGSDFDTVLAVYTSDQPASGYAGLRSVTCDNDGGPDGRTSRVELEANASRVYLVVVDGVSGARGNVQLHYELIEPRPQLPAAPKIGQQPQSRVLAIGGAVTFEALATGVEPLTYQWLKEGNVLAGETHPTLTLAGVQLQHAGSYSVQVANSGGSILSDPANLSVVGELSIRLDSEGSGLVFEFPAAGPIRFALDRADHLSPTTWISGDAIVDQPTGRVIRTNHLAAASLEFYRLRVE